ncbi:hypothetical protein [Flyfo podovirus Tbat2_2]|nr:hypothetical protein [Flyfo podovirus Tbat2_2]
MMYFSKEELELIRDMLEQLFMDGAGDDMADEMYTKVKHQLEEME